MLRAGGRPIDGSFGGGRLAGRYSAGRGMRWCPVMGRDSGGRLLRGGLWISFLVLYVGWALRWREGVARFGCVVLSGVVKKEENRRVDPKTGEGQRSRSGRRDLGFLLTM